MSSMKFFGDTESFVNLFMPSPTNSYNHLISSQGASSSSSESGNQRIAPKLPNHQYFSNHQQQEQQQEENPGLIRCKRRIHHSQLPYTKKGRGPQPAAVARRNERERNRVQQVNLGFAKLRLHVPNCAKNKKMSKVDTLKGAVQYIKILQGMLGENNPEHSIDENSYPVGGQSSTGSPTPSLCSDASSPYEMPLGEDDDLIEFASWL